MKDHIAEDVDHHRPPQSFQGRITAAIMLTAIAVLMVGCVLFMVEQQRSDRAGMERIGQHFAAFIATGAAPAAGGGDGREAARTLSLLRAFPLIEYAQVRDVRGRVLATYGNGTATSPRDLVWSAPVYVQKRHVGTVMLRVQAPVMRSRMSHYLSLGGALFFAATGLALFLGRWLAARISDPVARLSQSMDEVRRSGNFATRVEPFANDELGRLTENFNVLLAALNENDQKLRGAMADLVEARDAAEAANVQKSQFLANMSHEIRTPLNGVLTMAQVMARDNATPAQKARLDVIRTSGESLLAILNDILDVSKMEAGKLDLEVLTFDLADFAAEVHAAFQAQAEAKGLALEVEIEDGAGGVRRGDVVRLRQILTNLVSNAVKFTEHGGVYVRISQDSTVGEDGVCIAVRDTGMGIEASKHSSLFKKFSQLDASMTRRFGGTGLGLAICHDLAGLMGGRVWMESEVGAGSTFYASLPLPRAAPPEAEPAAAASDAPDLAETALRVLAAEDNPTNQLVLSTVMQIFGVELVMVADGVQAVEAWRRDAFDVILMDIQMPVMDGIAATRAIREEEAASGRPRTPIIALSANALVHQVSEYLVAGMDRHVAKPIELEKLQEALEAVLTPDDGCDMAEAPEAAA